MNKNISIQSTKSELNKAVKELNSELYRLSFQSNDEQYNFIENEGKEQFIRIHEAITDFEVLNKRNVLILYRLNLQYRFIPFHVFGQKINLFLN